jgi:hypothetical protein
MRSLRCAEAAVPAAAPGPPTASSDYNDTVPRSPWCACVDRAGNPRPAPHGPDVSCLTCGRLVQLDHDYFPWSMVNALRAEARAVAVDLRVWEARRKLFASETCLRQAGLPLDNTLALAVLSVKHQAASDRREREVFADPDEEYTEPWAKARRADGARLIEWLRAHGDHGGLSHYIYLRRIRRWQSAFDRILYRGFPYPTHRVVEEMCHAVHLLPSELPEDVWITEGASA